MYINSALVSAQNRQRFYAFNWKVEQSQDRGILLADILESGQDLCGNEKSYCLTASYDGAVPQNTLMRKQRTMIAEPVQTTNGMRKPPVMFQNPHGFNKGGIKYDKAPTITATGSYTTNNFVIDEASAAILINPLQSGKRVV